MLGSGSGQRSGTPGHASQMCSMDAHRRHAPWHASPMCSVDMRGRCASWTRSGTGAVGVLWGTYAVLCLEVMFHGCALWLCTWRWFWLIQDEHFENSNCYMAYFSAYLKHVYVCVTNKYMLSIMHDTELPFKNDSFLV